LLPVTCLLVSPASAYPSSDEEGANDRMITKMRAVLIVTNLMWRSFK